MLLNNILKFHDIHILQLAIYKYKLESRRNFEGVHVHSTRNRSTLNPSFARLILRNIGFRLVQLIGGTIYPKTLSNLERYVLVRVELRSISLANTEGNDLI